MISSAEKLAQALHAHGLSDMEKKARENYYDDFKSPLPMPKVALVSELSRLGQSELASRVANGEFDSTKEEAEAWYEQEGSKLL